MRRSLIDAARVSPDPNQREYARGSIILCNHCALPIYRLERGIGIGEKAGRAVSAFKPVRLRDVLWLVGRVDVDPGLRATLGMMTIAEHRALIDHIGEPRTGDPALCPHCGHGFVQARTVERAETIDRAYVWELLTVPPAGIAPPIRGKNPWMLH